MEEHIDGGTRCMGDWVAMEMSEVSHGRYSIWLALGVS